MAGGKGTRLSSLTGGEIPKPMVPIAGKPILEHQINVLKENGISDIVIIGGHLFDKIQDYFFDGSEWSVHIEYITEEKPLGTAGALFYLKERIQEDFLLVYGDIIFDMDVQRFAREHREKMAEISIVVHPNSHPYDSDVVAVNREGYVNHFFSKKKPRETYVKNLVNAGLYMISPKFLNLISVPEKCDLEHDLIFLDTMSEKKIFAYRTPEYIKDVGTPERLKKTELDMKNGIVTQRNLKNKQKCLFLDRDGTINKHIGFLSKPEEMMLEEHAAEAIRLINESGYLCVVVTNQPVIARNDCTFEELELIHAKMETLLGEQGAYLDDIFYCPHHPDGGYKGENAEYKIKCECRKPEIGLITQSMIKYNIDLTQSWMVGDTTRDVQTGINAGVKTAGVRTGEGCRDRKFDVGADIYGEDLLDVVNRIVKNNLD